MHRRMRGMAAATALLSTLTAAPLPAHAGPRSAGASQRAREASKLSDVDSAEKYYASMDYENANGIAARALAGRGLTHDQLVRGYRVLALTFATLGKEDQARDAFTMLLSIDPDYQLDPNLGPRVTTPFIEARGYWRGQSQKPGIEVTATVHSNDSAKLVITTRDPMHVIANVNLGWRWSQDAQFTTRPLAIGEGVSFAIPPAANATATRLDYYVEGLDDHDNVIFEVGNPGVPKTALVDAPLVPAAAVPLAGKPETVQGGGKSIFASPIFWTVAGVVVAGAAVTTFILLRPKEPGGATLTGAADCGGQPCH